MKLQKVKGNTYVLEASTALLPIYLLPDNGAVLMDTGYARLDRAALAELFDHHLKLRAILCTHAHFDHSGNVRYLQQRYGVPAAAHLIEAGIAVDSAAYRANYVALTYGKSHELFLEECFTADTVVRPGDNAITLGGAEFTVLPLPGHSAGHMGVITPDNVAYVGDCIIDEEQIAAAKLPTTMFVARDLESKRALRDLRCDSYILAHKSVHTDISALIETNIAFFHRKKEELLDCLDDGMRLAQWLDAFCQRAQIRTRNTLKYSIVERNFNSFVDWMTDEGTVELRRNDSEKIFFKNF